MSVPATAAAPTPPPPVGAPLLKIEDVSIGFGAQQILRNISLDVPRGQTLSIIGESGCGKTVMLKLIIGLLRATTGRIVFDGKILLDLGDEELTRQRFRFGFLFQGAALFDSMNVFDNVAFGMRELKKYGDHEIRENVRQRLKEVGLAANVEPKMPAELSGGMKKRVGLARALAIDPEVMLYDEPTTGLDPIMSDVINELILLVRHKRPVTSIVVTHDMTTVKKVADRVVMFYPLSRLGPNESQILYDGPAAGMDEHPDTRARQFVRGEAGERLTELRHGNNNDRGTSA